MTTVFNAESTIVNPTIRPKPRYSVMSKVPELSLSTVVTLELIWSQTPANESTSHRIVTATTATMPSATDNAKDTFATDHGSTRTIFSRAWRTPPAGISTMGARFRSSLTAGNTAVL